MKLPRAKYGFIGLVAAVLAALVIVLGLRWRTWSEGEVLAEFVARPVSQYDLGERFLVRRVGTGTSPMAISFPVTDYMYVCEVRRGRFLMATHGFMTESYGESNASARWANASELSEAQLEPDRNRDDAEAHAFFSIGKEYRFIYLRETNGKYRWVNLR